MEGNVTTGQLLRTKNTHMFKVACKEVSAVIYQYDPCMIMVKHIASIQER